jgi:DNA-binding NarL/FixJ family response regulator
MLIGKALRLLLLAAGLVVVGEVSVGEEAVELVRRLRPDLVLLELIPRGSISGIETIEALAASAPDSRVLVLAASHEPDLALEAMLAGASGYMLKNAGPEEIVRGVEQAAEGKCVISPEVAEQLIERLREREFPVTVGGDDPAEAICDRLTDRELEILRRLASGRTNEEIGEDLSLSCNTVKNHVASILEKLQLDNRVQAAVQAVRAGIA